MKRIENELTEFKESILEFHIPRWDELPDLDLYMDQVITFIEKDFSKFFPDGKEKFITPSMINNYVKLKLIPKPIKKKYNKVHLAYLITISILKQVFTIQEIKFGIILQSSLEGEKRAYNSFCQEQENALKYLICQINSSETKAVEFMQAIDSSTDNLITKMATHALASKIITKKLIEVETAISD